MKGSAPTAIAPTAATLPTPQVLATQVAQWANSLQYTQKIAVVKEISVFYSDTLHKDPVTVDTLLPISQGFFAPLLHHLSQHLQSARTVQGVRHALAAFRLLGESKDAMAWEAFTTAEQRLPTLPESVRLAQMKRQRRQLEASLDSKREEISHLTNRIRSAQQLIQDQQKTLLEHEHKKKERAILRYVLQQQAKYWQDQASTWTEQMQPLTMHVSNKEKQKKTEATLSSDLKFDNPLMVELRALMQSLQSITEAKLFNENERISISNKMDQILQENEPIALLQSLTLILRSETRDLWQRVSQIHTLQSDADQLQIKQDGSVMLDDPIQHLKQVLHEKRKQHLKDYQKLQNVWIQCRQVERQIQQIWHRLEREHLSIRLEDRQNLEKILKENAEVASLKAANNFLFAQEGIWQKRVDMAEGERQQFLAQQESLRQMKNAISLKQRQIHAILKLAQQTHEWIGSLQKESASLQLPVLESIDFRNIMQREVLATLRVPLRRFQRESWQRLDRIHFDRVLQSMYEKAGFSLCHTLDTSMHHFFYLKMEKYQAEDAAALKKRVNEELIAILNAQTSEWNRRIGSSLFIPSWSSLTNEMVNEIRNKDELLLTQDLPRLIAKSEDAKEALNLIEKIRNVVQEREQLFNGKAIAASWRVQGKTLSAYLDEWHTMLVKRDLRQQKIW